MNRSKSDANGRNPAVRVLWVFLAALMVATSFVGTPIYAAEENSQTDKSEYASVAFSEDSYSGYSNKYSGVARYTGDDIVVKGNSYIDTNINIVEYPDGFEGMSDVVYFKEQSAHQEETAADIENFEGGVELTNEEPAYLTYKVEIPVTGLYNVAFLYYPVEGRGAAIEREFLIDGELPFNESGYVSFSRVWADTPAVNGGLFDTDAVGNEIRSTQVETPKWCVEALDDDKGYYYKPFEYYLEAGTHEITIKAIKEPMVLAQIVFSAPVDAPTYAEVLEGYKANGYTETSGVSVKIEGELPSAKSDSSLYALHDRSSVANSPATAPDGKFSYDHTQLNIIGGERWASAGQWISWKFTVPESGLYKISLRGKQAVNRGMYSCRSLSINGEIPFAEAEKFAFMYSGDYKVVTLSSEEGDPYLFYFEADKEYELTFEATLGTVESLARDADSLLAEMTSLYRRFLMIIGPNADTYRDYRFDKYMPEEVAKLGELADVVDGLVARLEDIAGGSTQNGVMLKRVAERMHKMSRRSTTIAKHFNNFKNDLGAIGNWILELNNQPFTLDYILISSPETKNPKANAGFFAGIGHEIKLFISSFINDYSVAGSADDSSDAITVWLGTGALSVSGMGVGREQLTLLKQMIDDSFSSVYNIPVNVRFISMGALLPATLAGKGPDVALSLGAADVINYAMRGAVHPLSDFEDYEAVSERFFDSALVPFTYIGDVYALPETQTYPVLFYRTDILEEMGLSVPQTWADVYDMIPDLQTNYMDIGVPGDNSTYHMFILQRGSQIYRGEGELLGIASNLDSSEAIDAFIAFTNLYRSYDLPLSYDFQNRFRRGEVPIAIADFTTYNVISIAAPEIRGLWSFGLVPGNERVNEETGETFIDRSVTTAGSGSIILAKSKHKEEAWEFMKWWSSDATQSRYAVELEAIIGTASRYASANREVMAKQPWTTAEYRVLSAQRTWAIGIPEVPGGYYATRHMTNAFNRVVTGSMDARETLLDYIDEINKELTSKREEMGLPTIDDVKGY